MPHIFHWSKTPSKAINRRRHAEKKLERERKAEKQRIKASNDVAAEETVDAHKWLVLNLC